jgi:hypothetical protein
MARKFLTHLDLAKNELQNGVIQNLAGAPATPVKGQIYFNSTDNTMYWWDGTGWVSSRGGGTGFPGFGAVTPETAFGSASADGVGATTSHTDHRHGTPVHDNAAHSAVNLNALAPPTGSVSMNGQLITALQSPTSGLEAANKQYVDNLAAGLAWKDSVRVATIANITIATALNSGDVLDGVTLALNDRVLVKNQTAPAENGIYDVKPSPTRSLDAVDGPGLVGATVFVQEGTHADQAWTMTTNAPITVGTTGLVWVQFGAGTAYVAGAGLTLTTNTLDVGAGTGITVAADTVAVNYGGDGAAATSARSDHTHGSTYPPSSRSIATTLPLTGGGDLSANRTLAINNFAGSVPGAVPTSVGGTTTWLRADGTWTAVPLDTTAGDVRYTRKYYVALGAGTSTVLTHNLNTRECSITVYRNSTPYDEVECDTERTTLNTATVRFNTAIGVGEYIAVVIG